MRGGRAGAAVALVDLEDELLGSLKRESGIFFAILVGLGDNAPPCLNEAAQEGGARDNATVVDGIPTGRHLVDEGADVARSPHIFELVLLLQRVTDGDKVGCSALIVEL